MQHLISKPSGTDLASQLWSAVFASSSFDNAPQNRRSESKKDGTQNQCDEDWDIVKNKIKNVIPGMARYYRVTHTASIEYQTTDKHFSDIADIIDFLYEFEQKEGCSILNLIQVKDIYEKIKDLKYILESAQNSILNEKNFDKKVDKFKKLSNYLDNLTAEIKVKFGS